MVRLSKTNQRKLCSNDYTEWISSLSSAQSQHSNRPQGHQKLVLNFQSIHTENTVLIQRTISEVCKRGKNVFNSIRPPFLPATEYNIMEEMSDDSKSVQFFGSC